MFFSPLCCPCQADLAICCWQGQGVVCPVDESGRFTHEVVDFTGQYIKGQPCFPNFLITSCGHNVTHFPPLVNKTTHGECWIALDFISFNTIIR